MVAVVSLSILFNIPRYLNSHVVKRSDGSVMVARTYLGKNSIFQLIYAGLFYYIVIYAIPIFLLAVMTYRHLVCALPSFFKPRLPIFTPVNVESFHSFNSTQSPLWQITLLIYFAFTSFFESLSCNRLCLNALLCLLVTAVCRNDLKRHKISFFVFFALTETRYVTAVPFLAPAHHLLFLPPWPTVWS